MKSNPELNLKKNRKPSFLGIIDSRNKYLERYKNLILEVEQLKSDNERLRATINNEKIASQALLNAIPDTIILLDVEGNYLDIYSEDENENILIRPSSELIGNNIADFLPQEITNLCFEAINLSIAENNIKQIHYELEIYGERKYFETRFSPINKTEVLCIIRDISDNTRKKQEIKERNDWFMSIFNASRDGFVVEHNERMVYINDAFVQLYKYDDVDELVGKNISIIQAEETDEMMREFGERRLRGEPVPGVYEAKGRCKDGSIIDIEVTASVFEVNGQKYIIDINRNISERKNFERRLKEQNEELQKINLELDRFVYSASHDLRAPLRSLLGLAQLFRIDSNEGRKEEYLQRMEKSINNLDNFIKDIIDYSRNSRQMIEYEYINLYELINTILEDIKYESNQQHIAVYAQYDVNLSIYTDRNRLSTILSNIFSNSFRYHNPLIENPYIIISASTTDHDYTIEIEDNGIGIGEEHLDKIFNMFYRAHDKKVGSGLGLYIVKETVNMLKGEVSVKSKLDQGTKFILNIPNNPIQ